MKTGRVSEVCIRIVGIYILSTTSTQIQTVNVAMASRVRGVGAGEVVAVAAGDRMKHCAC